MGIILFKTLAPHISRAALEQRCRQFDGYLSLELSEANEAKRFHRLGWAYYQPSTDLAAIVRALDGTTVRAPWATRVGL